MEAGTDKTVPRTRDAEIARGLRIKQNNAIAAAVTGSALAGAMTRLYGFGPPEFAPLAVVLGAVCGVVYANAFEYLLHRFFLHGGQGFLVRSHALHHNSTSAPEEPRYINFASSPWVVILVFVLNAVPVFAGVFILQRWLAARLEMAMFGAGPFGIGMLGGFTLYYILYEEVHWRIHMGGWLPRRLSFARRHHLLHHGDVEGCYNVFLPLCDWLLARLQGKRGLPQSR